MNNKVIAAFGIVFLVGVVSLIGVLAYRGDQSVKGPNYDTAVQAQLEQAIESKDYDAWIRIRQENNLPMNGRVFQVINKENFARFAEMHEAMQSGDTAGADSIRSELGLGQGMMKGKGANAGASKGCSAGNCQERAGFVDADNDGACDNYALHHQ
jgi:hypothetical protein